MLWQRIVTAVVLLALLVPALFAPLDWPFNLLTLLLIGAAGWEWARLNQVGMPASLGIGLRAGIGLCGRAGCRLVAETARIGVVAGDRGVGGGRRAGIAQWPVAVAPSAQAGASGAGPGGAVGRLAGDEPCAQPRHQLHPVGVLPGVGGRHCRLLRRPPLRQAQARAQHQPRQELGRCLQWHGRGVRADAGLARDGIALPYRQPQSVSANCWPTWACSAVWQRWPSWLA